MADARDAVTKLDRANKHLEELQVRIREFLENGAYRAVPYLDFQRLGIPVVGRVLAEPPVYEWGPVIGDIVHNTRSALDNLVWALSEHVAGPAPSPPNRQWRQVQFPIITEQKDWPGNRGLGCLWAIPTLHAEFERLQPFRTGPSDPSREPLAVLQALWNLDKHRHVHLAQCFVSLQDALSLSEEEFRKPKRRVTYGLGGYCTNCPGPPEHDHPLHNIIEDVVRAEPGRIRYKVVEPAPPGPFKDGVELGVVQLVIAPGDWVVGAPHFDVDPVLAFDVAFEQGAPAYGGRLVQTLQTLLNTTTAIVA